MYVGNVVGGPAVGARRRCQNIIEMKNNRKTFGGNRVASAERIFERFNGERNYE